MTAFGLFCLFQDEIIVEDFRSNIDFFDSDDKIYVRDKKREIWRDL